MQPDVPSNISSRLEERIKNHAFRNLTSDFGVDFASNDFLGLATNPHLLARIRDRISTLEQVGSGGSRLLSGHSKAFDRVETMLASAFGCASALLFNSGYAANLALVSSVPNRTDTILYDEKCHASIKDGARLSLAAKYSFKHNDASDLKRKLNHVVSGDCFVIVESMYSMDGDFCQIRELAEVCQRAGAYLIVDEAHTTGIYGGETCSWVCEQQMEQAVFARVHTFGKAMGVSGACIVGSDSLKDYLINFARPFIYTTAMNHLSLIAIEESFQYLLEHPELRTTLQDNITYFKQQMDSEVSGVIQPVIVSGNERIKKLAHALQKDKFDVRPILSPTVKAGTERLRICLHSFNTKPEILALTDRIKTQ